MEADLRSLNTYLKGRKLFRTTFLIKIYGAADLPRNSVPYLLECYFQLTMPIYYIGMRVKVQKKDWEDPARMDQMFWLFMSPYHASVEVFILRVDVEMAVVKVTWGHNGCIFVQ